MHPDPDPDMTDRIPAPSVLPTDHPSNCETDTDTDRIQPAPGPKDAHNFCGSN